MGEKAIDASEKAGELNRRVPLQVPQWQGKQVPLGLRPPPGSRPATSTSAARVQPPGDARGEAPCIRKLRFSPFPGGEGGRGDGGEKVS